MGDVKLALFLGAGLGVPVVVAFFLGFFAAFVPALALFVTRGRAARKLDPAGAVPRARSGDRPLRGRCHPRLVRRARHAGMTRPAARR